jgi:uncharacterized protein (DUF927 family)
MEPFEEASGGFHLVGPSKAGKTLAVRMGVSVWGFSPSTTAHSGRGIPP